MTNDKSMAQLSRVHPSAEGVAPERVPRGPLIKPPAMRVVANSCVDLVQFMGSWHLLDHSLYNSHQVRVLGDPRDCSLLVVEMPDLSWYILPNVFMNLIFYLSLAVIYTSHKYEDARNADY
jgi:hypothetical protein